MTTAKPDNRRHVPALDLVRVITFAAVIAVHVVSYDGRYNVAANGVEVVLHFTREAFFALTGFVLIHQYQNRKYGVGRFYRRRLKGVGIPYVVWSLIYSVIAWYQGPRTESFAHWASEFGWNLLDGGACYHLYFLVVSIQVYLLFPLIERLLRATRGHHVLLLVVSAAVQLAVTALIDNPPADGPLLSVIRHADVLVTSYQFYILLGAVAAAHLDEITSWIRRWWPTLVVLLAAAVALGEAVYLHKVDDGIVPRTAGAVLQPAMLPIATAVIAVLFAVGTWWADHRRRGGLTEKFYSIGSDRSFGIFLVHPEVLRLVSKVDSHWWPRGVSALPVTLVRYVLVIVVSVAVTEIFRRTVLSLPLTGRSRLVRRSTPKPQERKDDRHADDLPETAVPHAETAIRRADDDDRQWPPEPVLR